MKRRSRSALRGLRMIPLLALFALAQLHAEPAATPAAKGAWKDQFKPKSGAVPEAPPPKVREKVTYTLQRAKEPTEEEVAAYAAITEGMDKAVRAYNENTTSIRQHVNVSYSPGTPTADGSSNGSIRLGKYSRNQRVCMHELAHTLGVGTSAEWAKLVVDGVFTGSNATRQLQEITGDPKAALHADRAHFWPYGLNYDNEVHSDTDFVNHCKMVEAICKDLKTTR